MNTIGIDYTFISDDEIKKRSFNGSLAIFTADILRGFSKINENDRFSLIINSAAEKLVKTMFPQYRIITVGGIVSNTAFYMRGKQQSSRGLKRSGHFANMLKRQKIDKMWFPWMVPEEIGNINCEYVGTCHDLKMRSSNTDESCMNMFSNSKRIIAISDYIRNQIINTYQINENKITTIPNCLYMTEKNVETKEISKLKGKKFILDVNAYIEEKNTMTMLKAFNRIKDAANCNLVLCGGYGNEKYICKCQNYIKDKQLSDRVFMVLGISEEEKNWLFHNCMLFVTPSENEGFGRTPIEAALCKKPVISTKHTALIETTAGKFFYYVNPKDDLELAEKILYITNNPISDEQLQSTQKFFHERYSLESVANRYMIFFDELSWL